MMEKIITTLIGALLPFIATYFSKLNKNNIRKNMMEEAQKRIDFINSYFEVSNKLLGEIELSNLKNQLANELTEIKNRISVLYQKEEIVGYQKLNTVQKVFITFKPHSILGWVWAILFYLFFILDIFIILGFFVDDNDNFSMQALHDHLKDTDLIIGFIICLLFPLLFRYLAIINFRKNT